MVLLLDSYMNQNDYVPTYQQNMENHFRKKNTILCANCGGVGHIYKSCNHPVISYGVICYQMFYDLDTNSIYTSGKSQFLSWFLLLFVRTF